MEKKHTELVCIIDKSGSMSHLEGDTIGGFNTLINNQKEEEGTVLVTTVLFNTNNTILHNRIPLEEIEPLTKKEYSASGGTALLDAVGTTIDMLSKKIAQTETTTYPTVLCVIMTDGEENSSCNYTLKRVKKAIEFYKENHNWEFIFLGAHIDAFQTALDLGIQKERASSFHADKEGITINFEVLSESISHFRASEGIDDSWKDKIEKDFNSRK
jgi:uncharacterized protein YegL